MLALIQPRISSKRLSNKIFINLFGKPIMKHVIDRVKKSKRVKKIIILKNKKKHKKYDLITNIFQKKFPRGQSVFK